MSLKSVMDLPCSSYGKESARNAGDPGSIPESGRSSEEGNGNPLQYSCLENSMDRGDWWATYSPWSCKESDTTKPTNTMFYGRLNNAFHLLSPQDVHILIPGI